MNDLLAAAKGAGLDKVSTQKLVQKLVIMGYSINPESILSILNGNPFVATADETQVTLGQMDDSEMGMTEPAPTTNDKVDSMAQTAVKKGGL